MKIENLQKVNSLYAELNANKTRLKNIENETVKLYGMELRYENDDQMFLKDDELLANVRGMTYVHILKKNKEIKERLKELGVEVDEISN